MQLFSIWKELWVSTPIVLLKKRKRNNKKCVWENANKRKLGVQNWSLLYHDFFYQATLLTTAVLEYHCSLMFLKSKGLNIKENKSRLLMYCVSLHDWYNDSTQALLPWHPIKCIHCCVITSVDVNTRWRTQLLRWEAK